MRAARIYLFVAVVLLGATLTLALGTAAGRFVRCRADRCVHMVRQ